MPEQPLLSLSQAAPGTGYVDGEIAYIKINYAPRSYFKPYHQRPQRFAAVVAHRRAGKTVACIHDMQRAALQSTQDRTLFAYIAPTYSQAEATAFDYLKDAAAPYIAMGLATVNKTKLQVTYYNGATIRLFGADNYDTLRGLRLDGVVLDEYANFDPRAWTQVIRPAISDRRGFATFIGTPRGHDHFYRIYREALDSPGEWFTACLKASDLVPLNDLDPQAKEKNLLTSDELEAAKRQMSQEWYNQEYECDFEASNPGAYYGKLIAEAQKEGRITSIAWDRRYPVYTAWDIGGNRDATCIWFAQCVGNLVYLIDYLEDTGADSTPYAKAVLDKPYTYAQHFLPIDSTARHPGSQRDYREALEDLRLRNITVLPKPVLELGINNVRLLLPRCHFDKDKCERGIEALKMYQTEWNEKDGVFKATPKHDWASHGADAFRYLAMALDKHKSSPDFSRKLIYPKGF